MSVVEDRPGARRAEVPLGEAGACVELDLAVLEARVEVEQDDQAVVDAGSPDAPLVHQGGGVGLGFLGRDVVAPEGLGVDDDLGLGLRLDRVDDLLGLALGRRREDLGVVVDGLAVDRLGEGRSGAVAARRRGDGGPAASATSHRTAAMRQGAAGRCMALIVRHAITIVARRRAERRRPVRSRGRPAARAAGRCRSTRARRHRRRRRRSPRGRRGGAAAGRAMPRASVDSQIGPSTRVGSSAAARRASAVDRPARARSAPRSGAGRRTGRAG